MLTSLCCGGFGPGVPGTRIARSDTSGRFGRWQTASRSIATRVIAGSASARFAFGWIAGPRQSTDTGLARLTGRGLGPIFRVFPPMTVSSEIARATNGTFAMIGQVSVATKDARTRRSIYLTVYRPRHGFTRPIKLAGRGDHAWLAVAVTPRGDALAAWARSGAVMVRERSSAGRLGPARRISEDPHAGALSAALTHDGTAAVSWISQPQRTPLISSLQIALRPAKGHFGIVRTMEQMPGGTEDIELLAAAPREIVAGWIGHNSDGGAARVASTTGVRLGPVQTLGSGEAGDLHLAPRGGGELIATWHESSLLRAAVRPAGTVTFGAPERIAGPATIGLSYLAFDPATGRNVVAWSQGQGVPDVVYTSTR